MNISNLNQAFIEIAEKKNQLNRYGHEDQKYSSLMEEIATLQDKFQYEYGAYIEEALFNVHDEFCPDNEVKKPVLYMANSYASGNETCEYDVANDEGIAVEADDFPGINAKLVLVPGPTRLILQGQTVPFKETVWIASEN
ncbi:MAG: hypothetical protein CMP48_09150 [Rickettsiales bacterium]|nr:hypothetical protein [Rickettsiales bacterium]